MTAMNLYVKEEQLKSSVRGQDVSRCSMSVTSHLERLRLLELERVRLFFSSHSKVLELGAGSGYQAAILDTWGHHVTAVDIAISPSWSPMWFPVLQFNGKVLEYEDEQFDVVFSSNVLEHVKDVESLLAESRRVLRKGGTAIHILPTPQWRLWTSLAHYIHVVLRVAGVRRPHEGDALIAIAGEVRKKGVLPMLKRAMIAGPHGEYPSAFSELYYFSRYRWMGVFREVGFEVVDVVNSGIFYTGYSLIPTLPLRVRQCLARIFGSSTIAYILRPR